MWMRPSTSVSACSKPAGIRSRTEPKSCYSAKTVILSGADSPRSGESAESKDQIMMAGPMMWKGVLSAVTVRTPRDLSVELAAPGSFDCGVLRFANDTSAQDDKV